MPHNPHCSGCPLCRSEVFAPISQAVARFAAPSRYAPPDPYEAGLDKMRAPLVPTPDLDPNYNPATGAPADGYAIARAIAKVLAEEENKK
jgi:hypothetical protein